MNNLRRLLKTTTTATKKQTNTGCILESRAHMSYSALVSKKKKDIQALFWCLIFSGSGGRLLRKLDINISFCKRCLHEIIKKNRRAEIIKHNYVWKLCKIVNNWIVAVFSSICKKLHTVHELQKSPTNS